MDNDFLLFFEQQRRFEGLSHTDQILRTGWFLQVICNRDRFDAAMINALYRGASLVPIQTSVYLPRMADRKPPFLLKDSRGYRLEGRTRKALDDLLGGHPTTVLVSSLLASLSNRMSDGVEQAFLDETVRCYKAAAFRAAIVMAWNLCYDHLRRWILADQVRLAAFNAGSALRFPKTPIVVTRAADFDELKEANFIDCCQRGNLISGNVETILREKLRRRNIAAHPSNVKISQAQADDAIIDLVENIVLAADFAI